MKFETISRWVLAALLLAPAITQAQEVPAGAVPGSVVDQITHGGGEGGTLLLEGVLDQLPVDAGYDELTAEQAARLRATVSAAGQEQPAYPRHGFLPLIEALLAPQQMLKVDGELKLSVDVDAEGHPQSVAVLASPDKQLMQIAARTLLQQQYTPAHCDGHACAGKVVVGLDLIRVDSSSGGSCSPPPAYPPKALRAEADGVVSVLLHLSPTGQVVDTVLLHSAGKSREHKLLDRTTLDYLGSQNYGQMLRKGQAVGGWGLIEQAWHLQ